MGSTDRPAATPEAPGVRLPGGLAPSTAVTAAAEEPVSRGLRRFAPAAAAYLFLVALLLAADTSAVDVARYTGYALWSLLLPGTLVFRALRRHPYTLVEDLALGVVTGLVLELGAWALLMTLGCQKAAVAWPLVVVVPFVAVPGLRRHWRPRGYRRQSEGWSWAVAGVVALTSAYYYEVFLARFPILPTSETTRQYGDLPYLLSLAGNAKHDFPLTLPQVAGEPLHYHWFTFVHMAMGDLVGHIDLPVIEMRLMVPALAALGILVIAVVAQRLSGRAWAGPVAAVLVFAVGEFTAAYPNNVSSWTFGAPGVRLMSFVSLSLTYSQPLLIALIGVVGDVLRRGREAGARDVPPLGRGAYVLAALLALASSAAKASSLPVTLAGLAFAGLMVLVGTRRIPWPIVALGAVVGAAQLFATAVVFDFESYGLEVMPFGNVQQYWADPQHSRTAAVQAVVVAAILGAFLLNHQLKVVGMLPLMWRRRFNLEPAQWFLLGGALAGPAAYLAVNGFNSSYFTLAGLPFGVLLSAWGYGEAFERAALPRRAKAALAVGTLVLAAVPTYLLYRYSADWARWAIGLFGDGRTWHSYSPLLPALAAGGVLAAVASAGAALWWSLARVVPAMRRRGGIVLLTATLAVGLPGLGLDVLQARHVTWEGSWVLPRSQVGGARWVRAHSDPADVLATNSHCWQFDDYAYGPSCDNYRSHWLGAYSERSVLIEGWAYAPRLMATSGGAASTAAPFWDEALLKLNEDAFYRPTADVLRRLHDDHRVRYLVVQRKAGAESPLLRDLAEDVFDNGRVAVYKLADPTDPTMKHGK
ncbi:hypothetical protein F7Q99_10495 [Streptomyces kaniharaensis]|uniref:Uncharacterized protein n=1 Tax=Streptomyces kaniharaensis TaxID=212423 RepID=A0A6N7KQJ5_9ACTN|nr:hypothetical protein [Streptomyces kaniharaensis]MQS12708.1 hypothetical protein [Streptomyces kaniharaensis]